MYQMISTRLELLRMRRRLTEAINVAEKAFEEVLQLIRPGVKEREIAAILECRMKMYGADEPSFPTIVASGKNSTLPHGRASDRLISSGDVVVIDFGARVNCYCSDITRTVLVGSVGSEVKDVVNAVLESIDEVIKNIKPNTIAEELDKIARNVLKEYRLDRYFIHSTGHGIGVEVHENPRIAPESKHKLLPGMIFTIEPGVYIRGRFGVRVEEIVLVTSTGCKKLTRTNRIFTV